MILEPGVRLMQSTRMNRVRALVRVPTIYLYDYQRMLELFILAERERNR